MGPLADISSTALLLIQNNLPRDLTWPFLLTTLALGIALWALRNGRGAKDATGQEQPAATLVHFLLHPLHHGLFPHWLAVKNLAQQKD